MTALTKQIVNDRLLLKGEGITCLEHVVGTGRKSLFRCKNEHEWWAFTGLVVNKGTRCPVCAGQAPVSHEEVNRRLEGRRIYCVEYGGNTHAKSVFECEKSHRWTASSGNVTNTGTGCPVCAGKATVSFEEVCRRLEDRKIRCVEYAGTARGKSTFVCAENHRWVAIANSIVNRGTGCPVCFGNAPIPHEEVNRRLKDRGIVCVEYKGMKRGKSTFVCKEQHQWATKAYNVMAGGGCPVCAPTGFNPLILAYLYYFKVQSRTLDLYKIGITNNHPHERAKGFQTDANLTLLDSLLVPAGRLAYPVEQHILSLHQQHISPDAKAIMENGYSEVFSHDVLGIESGNTLLRVFQDYWREHNILEFMRQGA